MSDSTEALRVLMQSTMTAYTMFYNKKYNRVESLFQVTIKAVKVDSESYLLHNSRYIHLNPRNHKTYFYSSYKNYLGTKSEPWLKIDKMLCLFKDTSEYELFVAEFYDKSTEEEYYQLTDR